MNEVGSKVLLMGKSGSGKTSMRSIVFANYLARDTWRLGYTMDVEHSTVRFLGSLTLSLWDCGGQDRFMENYFEAQRDHIFRGVEVLIYVFDVESAEKEKDIQYFKETVDALKQSSATAKVFCLFHKMDVILTERDRRRILEERTAEVAHVAAPLSLEAFGTSIWDETLYKAWSRIVNAMIPNKAKIDEALARLCSLCDADEIVLFEKATFLVIAHVQKQPHADQHRFEKISNIIKQFKLSCSNAQTQLDGMEVKNSSFAAFIDKFTSTTYIMLVSSDPRAQSAATLMNVEAARPVFESFIKL